MPSQYRAHYYCTLLLHLTTAPYYSTLLLHLTTAPYYCTLLLHITTAHYYCIRGTNLSCARRHLILYSMYYTSPIAVLLMYRCCGCTPSMPLLAVEVDPLLYWKASQRQLSLSQRAQPARKLKARILKQQKVIAPVYLLYTVTPGTDSQKLNMQWLTGKYIRALTFQKFSIVQIDF